MESIKIKNKYLDTQGIYDSVEGKTQDEINAEKVNNSDYNPTAKTSSMTKSVGKDSSGRLWTEPVESSEIASAAESWLASNITQETGYVIDASLSVTGAAADAKKTGDEIGELKSGFIDFKNYAIFPGNLIDPTTIVDNKFVKYNNGQETTDDMPGYFCTDYIPVTAGVKYKGNAGRNPVWYASDKSYLSGSNSSTAIKTGIVAPNGASFLRFSINKTTDNMQNAYSLYFAMDDDYSETTIFGINITDIKNLITGEDITSRFTFTASRRINWQTGEIQTNSSGLAKASDYVSVDGFDFIRITQRFRTETTTVAGLAFYDAEKSFISDCGIAEPVDENLNQDTYKISRISVPDGAKYLRTTWWGDSTEQAAEIEFSCFGETNETSASLKDLQDAIEELQNEFSDDNIPDYYHENNYIESRISDILTAISNASGQSTEHTKETENDVCHHGDQFFWFTDPHYFWYSKPEVHNGLHTADLIKYIQNRTNIRKTFCGGDLVGGSTMSASVCLRNLQLAKQHLSGIWDNLYMIIGNHEWNGFNNNDNLLAASQIYSLLVKDKEQQFGDVSDQGDYWFDNVPQKIRYFCIGVAWNAEIKDSQIAWFGRELLKVPSGYTVVVLSHIAISIGPPVDIKESFGPIVGLLEAAKAKSSYPDENPTYDFSTFDAEIACVISGHVHQDHYLWTKAKENGGVLIISTTCDRGKTDNSVAEFNAARVYGTITEQAIDVFVIDTDDKTIKTFRIGGSFDGTSSLETPDLTFSYGTEIGG